MNVPQKIILVQLFSNGDCLYATAVARQIKADYPGCHLTWAIADFCKSIISGNPFVDDIMVVTDVAKNDEAAFRKLKKELLNRKDKGEFDEVIITHIMGSNQANYDGCIRSAIFRGYHKLITLPVTPVLRLSIEEQEKANLFAHQHELNKYSQVILFEFAPQSGQSKINKDFAIELAEALTGQKM
ncbi:MAG: hypothetical protein IPJ81_18690 [Chitinophagaceae bacterium]|nr:hypothetical protein [Chitinophagaceae bacterium]